MVETVWWHKLLFENGFKKYCATAQCALCDRTMRIIKYLQFYLSISTNHSLCD